MSDPFESPKHLISQARDDIDDVAARTKAFFDAKPYTRVIEVDRNTRENVHKFRLITQLPAKISTVAKNAAGNLRDALDHAVYGSTVAILGGDPKDTGFPFAKDAAGVKGELGSKRLAGNAPEIRPFLAGLKPYEGGNDLLWGLNQIRNPNTHRIIVPVGHAVMQQSLMIRSGLITGGQIGYSRWDATKNEVEFMRLSPSSHVDYQVTAAFDVVFEGVHPLTGKPVVGTLRQLATEVETVVGGIEAETARIVRGRNK